jgi:acyl-CoA thioester hydrolase
MPPQPSLTQITELPRTHAAAIPPNYLDEMGHMNVMWYTYLFSQGIRGLLEHIGLNLDYIESKHAGTFALEKHVRYLAEVRVGEQVEVYSRAIARNGSRLHFVQFLVNATRGQLASIMETVSVHVDLNARRSSPMPSEIASQFDAMVAQHQTLSWQAPLCGIMGVDGKRLEG